MTIVVGYDGSEASRHALDRAARYATEGDPVIVVSAAELKVEPVLTEGGQLDPSERTKRERAAEEAIALLAESGVAAEPVVAQGDPGDAILRVAKDRDADLIIVGHRGHGRIGELLHLGSVTSKVAHRAHCDVLVVR